MTTAPHGQGRPDHHRVVWRVWDAGELASTHPTRADAQLARAALLAEHLDDFPHDQTDLEAALMIEPTTPACPAGDTATADQPDQRQAAVWALWDAADLVSLHATEHGARAARATHLAENAETDPADQSLLERFARISPILVHQP